MPLATAVAAETRLVFNLSYICPEPVLANIRVLLFLTMRGNKDVFRTGVDQRAWPNPIHHQPAVLTPLPDLGYHYGASFTLTTCRRHRDASLVESAVILAIYV